MSLVNLDFASLYPNVGCSIKDPIGDLGDSGFPHEYKDSTYEQHLKYLTDFISKNGWFDGFGMKTYVFKMLINEISLYNQNDENIFVKRVKNGKTDNDPPFYMTFDNLFWDSLPSIGVFPIRFYREEKMLKSKMCGKPIDVLLAKYDI